MQRHIIPDVVQRREILSLPETGTALEASQLMDNSNVAAIIVADSEGMLLGIVTERDLTRRVMAKGLDPNKVTVGRIMTKKPDTVAPGDRARDALDLMRTRSYRHLPVIDQGKVVAMVSVRDLYSAIKKDLEDDIHETEAYVFGDRYSASESQ